MQSRIPKPISNPRIVKEKNEIIATNSGRDRVVNSRTESKAAAIQDNTFDLSMASTDTGYEKILQNIDKLSKDLKNLEMKQDELGKAKGFLDEVTNISDVDSNEPFSLSSDKLLDSIPKPLILPNTQILQELEDRAKRLQREIASSLGESTSFPDDCFSLERMDDWDDDLPNLSTDDLELIGQLNSKIGLDLLMLDKSLSSLDSNEFDSGSSDAGDTKAQEIPPVPSAPIKELQPVTLIESPKGYNGILIKFISLELSEQVEKPSSLWIEYTTSNPEEDPVRFKITIPLKLSKPTIRVPFFRTHRVPKWNNNPKLIIRMFALGKKRDAKSKKDLVELWSAQGILKQSDLLYSDRYKLSTQVILCKDGAANQSKFNPASAYGQLTLELELTKPVLHIEPIIVEPVAKQTPPVYLNVTLSTIRGLKPSTAPVLLNLRFKVTKQDVFIETIPISYHDEFDANTGELVPPSSFKYTLTRPFQYSDIKSMPSPLIIEVYRHCSSCVESSMKYKDLVGLLRLPLASLVNAWDGVGVIEIPESDYGIVDPISGDCVGWVSSYMSLRDSLQLTLPEEKDELPNEIEPIERIPVQIESQSIQQNVALEEKSSPDPLTETTTLHVGIHRACGLLHLLESHEDSDHIAIALEKGPNIYITLNLFPEGETDISDLIITPVVAYSFTPNFDYSIQITVSCQDSDLLRWIKKGAFSIGKIYHRIPRHLIVNGIDSIYLGEFRLSLDSLLTSPNGIDHEWFFVQGGGAVQLSLCFDNGLYGWPHSEPHKNTSMAPSHLTSSWIEFWLDFHIEGIIVEGKLPAGDIIVEYKEPGQVESSTTKIMDKTMGLKSSLELMVDPFKSTCLPLYFYQRSYTDSNEYIGTVFLNLDIEIQQAKVILRTRSKSNDGSDDFPAIKKTLSLIQVDCPEWLDAAIQISLKVNAKRKKRKQVLVKSIDESTFLSESFIDNISKIEQVEDEIDHPEEVMVERLSSALPVEERKIRPFDFIESAVSPSTKEQQQPKENGIIPEYRVADKQQIPANSLKIPIYVSIEKAMNLPLVSDPLGASFPSPFVKSSDSFTSTLPNSFVTFSPPQKHFEIPSGSTKKPWVLSSPIIFNQTNPVWNFQTCISLILQMGSCYQLKEMRKPSNGFRFKVWHTPKEAEDHPFPTDSSDENECLGFCLVPLDPLFTGMTEIHGWYHIQDSDGISKGQLMIRICPTEDLGTILKDWSRDEENSFVYQDHDKESHFLQSKEADSFKEPFFLLKGKTTENVKSSDCVKKKPQDTFVWNGKQWEHKSMDTPLESNENNPRNVNENDIKTSKLSSSVFEKSISETIHDLDILRESMMTKLEKLNEFPEKKIKRKVNPIDHFPQHVVETHDVGTDAVMEAMTLPVVTDSSDQSQFFKEHPSNPFQDESMNESKIAYELNQFENVRNTNDSLSFSLLDISNPAISRTNDLMEKLEYLELQDPNFISDSILSGTVNESTHSLTRQELKEMLQSAPSFPFYPKIEQGKPPLAPTVSTITHPIATSSITRKWKELDEEIQEPVVTQIEETNRVIYSNPEETFLNLMQLKLGNISLESSTRIANVLRKSTSKDFTDL